MDEIDFLKTQLDALKKADLLRRLVCIESAQGTAVQIDGQEKVLFCSNNYLGLANDPRIVEAVCDAVRKYGHGAGASRLISGTMKPHVELEQSFCRLFQKEASLVFPSGWTANEAVLKTIPQKGDLVLLDKLDHASIIDAAGSSAAEFRTYRRGSLERLERLLSEGDYNRRFIVTESIFSMDGDKADLEALVELKKKYGAIVIVDEAHALGCLGQRGAGLAEEIGVLKDVDIVVATMSKVLGSAGGIVAAGKPVIEFLINKARSFIYTTAPTVANCVAALAAIEVITAEPGLRASLKQNADYLRTNIKALGLNTGPSTTHIIPVIIGASQQAVAASQALFEKGFFIPAIRPPTVPPNTARLRISVQSEHTKQQMDSLAAALANLPKP